MFKKKKNNKIRQKIIRLRKRGEINYPVYEIIVTFKDNRNRGPIIEKLGFFNPHKYEKKIFINTMRLAYWLTKGAYVNQTVKNYLIKFIGK